ncbi:DeoR/GlpR family DNA-binding transcription regulator [Oceanobacillus sojae]|uniref:DeoR/GlpR family DNA-binding transcription regulator n=1 Tax=Oceanobacillus sojae TaxID=582851 RepID=UPI0009888B08|nr:DeoR/GlpR family DNA-binding transcription regulator [Oceanobacillus sojae]MCT1901894.1 DeoR/GlpR family DNA-binding transcription regulator [Oceanobacillus sojae]
MLREERLKEIERILREKGRVEVGNLSRIFNVTEMTVRRDLDELATQQIAVRSHGGAIIHSDRLLAERPYELRILMNREEKEKIAEAGLSFINDGDKIFIDSSTTGYCLAHSIPNEKRLLIVTGTLSTAVELNNRPNLQVVFIGGDLEKETGSSKGYFAELMINAMNFDIAFIGVPKITPAGILTTSSIDELMIKKAVIKKAKKVIVLVDSSKIGEPDFLELCHISKIDTIITNKGIDEGFLQTCEEEGVEVVLTDV